MIPLLIKFYACQAIISVTSCNEDKRFNFLVTLRLDALNNSDAIEKTRQLKRFTVHGAANFKAVELLL